MKRFASLIAAVSVLAAGVTALAGGVASASGASGSMALPTLNIALTGAQGISVSGSMVTGAVQVVTTFSGKLPKGSQGAAVGIVRLNPGATIQQAAGAVQSHGGDINALSPYGSLFFDASAPSKMQTVFLSPGNYVALNVTGNGQPGFAPFTVTQAATPAALPAAKSTETAIEFTFHGPNVLHDGTIVRAQNHGWLVHMIDVFGVRSKAAGKHVIALMRAGAALRKIAPFLNGRDVTLMGPTSTGGLQQQVLNAKPGYYIEACFMNTQDGREHVQLGMERLVRIVK